MYWLGSATASTSARVGPIFTPNPANEYSGFNTQFSRSAGSDDTSLRNIVCGTLGCFRWGSENLLSRKYQFGVAGPLDIQLVAKIERRREVPANQLVDNDTVVDALDRPAGRPQFPAALLHLHHVDDAYAELFPRQQKITQGLLVKWVDFEQRHLFRLTIADDGPAQQRPVIVHQHRAARSIKHQLVRVGQHRLKRV